MFCVQSQTNAPKSCYMRPPGGILAPKESILASGKNSRVSNWYTYPHLGCTIGLWASRHNFCLIILGSYSRPYGEVGLQLQNSLKRRIIQQKRKEQRISLRLLA